MLLIRVRTGPDMVRVLAVAPTATIRDVLEALAVDAPELAARARAPGASLVSRGRGFQPDEPASHAAKLVLTLAVP
jgi:hypothetical protein